MNIGVLGAGFTGQTLLRQYPWSEGSWGTWHTAPVTALQIHQHHFAWGKPETFANVPDDDAVLVLTIPPQEKVADRELRRLHAWGAWMGLRRPRQRRLIYISSTAVYPRRDGLWTENASAVPDSESGLLRLKTEQALGDYFALQIVRAGGIYGPGRSLVERLSAGKRIPVDRALTHRIHVYDLCGIIHRLVECPDGPACVNAVDLDPRPTWEVANWLLEQHPDLQRSQTRLSPQAGVDAHASERRIDNHCLLHELNYQLRYPSFREGMLE